MCRTDPAFFWNRCPLSGNEKLRKIVLEAKSMVEEEIVEVSTGSVLLATTTKTIVLKQT